MFTPLQLGKLHLQHRVVMAPLTRQRAAEPTLAPTHLNAEYYAQRASKGGLLISEATMISPQGYGYYSVPGIWTDEHVRGWREVTDAVHAKGGRIFCQLWHIGRLTHPSIREHPAIGDAAGPVSSSAVRMDGVLRTYKGNLPAEVPRPLTVPEIKQLVQDYTNAARRAMQAGFDGVELHAAHGYLIDQFLCDGVNKRTDQYGGSIENRCRLLWEVIEALTAAVGEGRVACRLSPHETPEQCFFKCHDSNPGPLYTTAVKGLVKYNLAYLLITEPRWFPQKIVDKVEEDPGFKMPLVNGPKIRKVYKGVMIGAGGFVPATAKQAIESGVYDAVAFGRWFISNPDLPARIATNAKLNRYERRTFYTPGAEGYTDYPFLGQEDPKYPLIDQSAISTSLAKARL